MMEIAKVTSKGQITIPISIRRRLGINEGDKILFLNKDEGVLMVNPDTFQGDGSDILNKNTVDSLNKISNNSQKQVSSAVVNNFETMSKLTSTESLNETHTENQNEIISEELIEHKIQETQVNPQVCKPLDFESDNVSVNYTSLQSKSPSVSKEQDEPNDSKKTAGGIDLSTLLDDIRSIGSNI